MENPAQFFKVLDRSKLRIARPRKFVLLCGGPIHPNGASPLSAREQFLRSLPNRSKFETHDILLAEDVDNVFHPDSPYKNLIEFEVDIARVSDAVVLFSEGYGSLAELGAFSQIESISGRMLVIIQLSHYQQKSFVRNGPIRYLQDRDQTSVEVFDWRVNQHEGHAELDVNSFNRHIDDIRDAIHERLGGVPDTTTFNWDDFGHEIVFSASIADVFGAATFDDFKSTFESLGVNVSIPLIRRMLFCATTVKWLRQEQRGHRNFYLPNFRAQSCEFAFKEGTLPGLKDVARWKLAIRKYWQVHDRARSQLIVDRPREEAPA